MARTCVFCGGGPCTNEHVLPRWLRVAFPEEAQRDTLHVRTTEEAETSRRGNLLDAQAKIVCGPCNSGWMNGLEEGVRTYLPRMIKGKPVQLTRKKQTQLATWSLKTVMMLHCVYPKADQVSIPEHDYKDFFASKQPSDLMHIWVAYMPPPVDPYGIVQHPIQFLCQPRRTDVEIRNERGTHRVTGEAYVATLRIGHFVTQVLRLGAAGIEFDLTPSPVLAKHIWQIWPSFGTRPWPTASLENIGGFQGFANAISAPPPQ
jgi:hypothetical protein